MQEHEGGSRGPAVRGRGRRDDGARVEIWVRPSGHVATLSSQRGGSESSRDSEQDGELGSLSASDVRFSLSLSFPNHIHTSGSACPFLKKILVSLIFLISTLKVFCAKDVGFSIC